MTISKNRFSNILINAFVLIALGSVFQSCHKEEYLNPKPSTLITDETAFDSEERIQNQVNGLYAKLKNSNFLGSRYFIMGDIRSGDFISTNLNAATGATTYQMNAETTTDEVGDIWAYAYQAINASNVFVDNMYERGMEVAGEALGTNYIAEARLIRAVSYYYLLQLYARPYWDGNGASPGLPLRLEGNTDPNNYDLARSTVGETYAQIIEDLNFAEQNLPNQYGTDFLNTTRAHKNTAIAFKTKVYLSMQDYPNVILEANKIVPTTAPFSASTGVPNTLEPLIQNVFQEPFLTHESIFSMAFSSQDAQGTAMPAWYLPPKADGGSATNNGDGGYSLYPDGIPADPNWTDTDARREFLLVGPTSGKLWLTKFKGASPYTAYVPVIRYSEVLLNLSEALSRSTQTVDERAVQLLSAVRNRSDASTVFTAADFADVDDLIAMTIKERHIEFLGEGIRNSDIMRLGIDVPTKPAHSVPSVAPSAYNYIYPIPINELNLNDLMTNN